MTVELKILESRTGAGFRVQYRRRFLLWTYWSDTGHVRLQGRVLPVVYPTREMAEAEQALVARRHRLRHKSNWR